MKKTFIAALVCGLFAAGTVNAQTETYYGAQKGDFSISVNASPLLDYVGNMFNSSTEDYLTGLASGLAGRYFVSDQWAVGVGLNINRDKEVGYDYINTAKPNEITGKTNTFMSSYGLSIGGSYLLRPGKRLQPFVDVYAILSKTNILLGFENNAFENGSETQDNTILEIGFPIFVYGAAAEIGVEYFVTKQFSISAVMGLTAYSSISGTVSKFETDADMEQELIDELNFNNKSAKTSSISTSQTSGNISLNFYF